MTNLARPTRRSIALTLVLLAGLAASARGQETPLDRERLTRYARAYVALDAARAEFHATIARIHDDIGLARARQDLDATVTQIYADHGFTSEEYGSITLLISQNEQVRSVFEGIVRELRPAGAT
jgi:hypothetical protein